MSFILLHFYQITKKLFLFFLRGAMPCLQLEYVQRLSIYSEMGVASGTV